MARKVFWLGIALLSIGLVGLTCWVIYWELQVGGDNRLTRLEAMSLVKQGQGPFSGEPDHWPDFAGVLADFTNLQREFAEARPEPVDADGLVVHGWTPEALRAFDAQSSPDERAAADQFIEVLANSSIPSRLGLLARSHRFERPVTATRLLDLTYGDTTPARSLARAMTALMIRCWQAGGSRDTEAAAMFASILAIGRVYRYQFGDLNTIVGFAIQGQALGTIRQMCMLRPLSEHALTDCLEAIERETKAPGAEFALRSQRAIVIDTVQWSFTDNGNGDGYFLASENFAFGFLTGGKSKRIATGEGFFLAGKRETIKLVDQILGPYLELASQLPRDRIENPSRAESVEGSPRYRVVNVLLPSFRKPIAAQDQHLGEVAGTRTMLAIELFRLQNGRLPTELSELVPQILKHEPIDPFGPGNLRCRRVDPSTDSLSRDYLLYSVGSDRTDNDGAVNKKAFWTPLNGHRDGRGFDFPFNSPNPDSTLQLEPRVDAR